MNKIQFINFKEDLDYKKKPIYIKRMGNKELAIKSTLMGITGYQAGKRIHDLVKSKHSFNGKVLYTPKGGRKAGLIGAALATGLTAGTGSLLRRKLRKDKGKKQR